MPGCRNLRLVVHGDDFTILGHGEHLDWFKDKICDVTENGQFKDKVSNLNLNKEYELSMNTYTFARCTNAPKSRQTSVGCTIKSSKYISHVIGHEGPNSLLSQLFLD